MDVYSPKFDNFIGLWPILSKCTWVCLKISCYLDIHCEIIKLGTWMYSPFSDAPTLKFVVTQIRSTCSLGWFPLHYTLLWSSFMGSDWPGFDWSQRKHQTSPLELSKLLALWISICTGSIKSSAAFKAVWSTWGGWHPWLELPERLPKPPQNKVGGWSKALIKNNRKPCVFLFSGTKDILYVVLPRNMFQNAKWRSTNTASLLVLCWDSYWKNKPSQWTDEHLPLRGREFPD